MDESRSEVLQKLEEAVEQWSAQVAGAQQGLSEQLSRAQGRLEAASGDLGTLGHLPELLEALRGELEALRQRGSEPGAAPEGLDELRQELRGLRNDVNALQRDVAGLRGDLSVVPRLVQRLDELRRPSSEETAGADRGRAEAWQEVARLRAQLEQDPLSFSAADLTDLENQAYDEAGNRRRMGEILVAAGLLSPKQVEQALGEQERAPFRRLGSILLQEGLAPEEVIARVLAGQLRTRFVRLTEEEIDPEAVRLVGERMARHHTCVPIRAEEGRITLAMANPFDLIAIDDIELASHRRVESVVATSSDIEAAIARWYPQEMKSEK